MAKLSKGLAEVDEKVEGLRKKFEKTTTEAAKMKVELDKAQETIAAADNLVGKLEGEYQRWSGQVRTGIQISDHQLSRVFAVRVHERGDGSYLSGSVCLKDCSTITCARTIFASKGEMMKGHVLAENTNRRNSFVPQ